MTTFEPLQFRTETIRTEDSRRLEKMTWWVRTGNQSLMNSGGYWKCRMEKVSTVQTKERGATYDKGFAQSLKKDNSFYRDQEQHSQIMDYLK